MLTATVTDAATDPTIGQAASEADLGREQFLRMLIAQLENQDPLNPQDSTEFTAQLAQFSSLEQEIAMRESLDSISKGIARTDSVTAIGLVGQQVLAETGQVHVPEGGTTLQLELAGATDATAVDIVDASGRVVASLDLGELDAGRHAIAWDGIGDGGRAVAPGVYGISIDAAYEAEPVEATALVAGRVSGADVTGSAPMLLLGDIVLPLSSVREVRGAPVAEATP